jgi:hypothetical protein
MKPIYCFFGACIAILGSVVMHTDMASAQSVDDIPQNCQTDSRTQQGYQRGFHFGQLTVNQAWDTIRQDCNQLERFVAIVGSSFESLELPPNATRTAQCMHEGTENGGLQALQGLGPLCGEEVFDSQPMQSLRRRMLQEK